MNPETVRSILTDPKTSKRDVVTVALVLLDKLVELEEDQVKMQSELTRSKRTIRLLKEQVVEILQGEGE